MAVSSNDSPPPPVSPRVRLALAGLGFTQIIGFGTTYYLPGLLGGLIRQDLGLSGTVMLSGVSILLLASAFLGPATGRLQDRLGSRVPMAIGSVLMGVGLIILSLARDTTLYFLGWTVIALGSPATLYTAAFTALAQMAGRSARRAIVFLTLIGGLASSVVWPITAWLLNYMDWHRVVLLFGLVNLLACAPIHALLLDGKAQIREEGAAPENRIAPGLEAKAQPRAFLLLTIMLAMVSLVANAWSMLAFSILAGLGYPLPSAVLVASLVGVFQTLGRVGEFASGGRHSPLLTAQVSNGLFVIAFITLFAAGGGLGAGIAFAGLYGIANGLNTIVKGTLTLAIFGSDGYGERLGRVTFIPGLCAAASPVLAGLYLESTDAHGLVLALLCLCVAATGLMLMMMRHCRRHGLH